MSQAEIDVDEALVRRLLASLPSRWRHLREAPVLPVAVGWDNAVWRLGGVGGGYAVRVPVRAEAAPLLDNEARWGEEVGRPLRAGGVLVPRPVHHGVTPTLHPWPWLLVEWVPGVPVSRIAPPARAVVCATLAEVLPHLHRPAPPDAPVNPARGIPLGSRRAMTLEAAGRARTHLAGTSVVALLGIVDAACAAPAWPRPAVWCHGDLHDDNLVLDTASGRAVVGVLDFGDLTRGDPAVDLRVLWTTFEAGHRARATRLLEASGAYDEAVWTRARGWAAAFVLAVAGHARGRVQFAGVIDHALGQLEAR